MRKLQKQKIHLKPLAYLLMVLTCLWTTACTNTYYQALEKVGIQKRELLVDRVKETTEAQEEGKKEFVSAIETFKSVVTVKPSELEERYEGLNEAYQDAAESAENITKKIDAVESVALALFDEWDDELNEYSNTRLKAKSKEKLQTTRHQYEKYIRSAKKAEAKLNPALRAMHDQVLFLKHNLNASAVDAIQNEVIQIDKDVTSLLNSIQDSIQQADVFIKEIG